jgi:DNA-binding NtrC family response regulator
MGEPFVSLLFLPSISLNHFILCRANYFGLVGLVTQNEKPKKLKIMIIEDEEDILILYRDFLRVIGHEIVCGSHADNIMSDFEKNLPDVCLMDYKIPGHKSGRDAATEILIKYPLTPIIFITGYEQLRKEIANNAFFKDKNIHVLIKPVRLSGIEKVILDLVADSK